MLSVRRASYNERQDPPATQLPLAETIASGWEPRTTSPAHIDASTSTRFEK